MEQAVWTIDESRRARTADNRHRLCFPGQAAVGKESQRNL